jgi:hypothetical protein
MCNHHTGSQCRSSSGRLPRKGAAACRSRPTARWSNEIAVERIRRERMRELLGVIRFSAPRTNADFRVPSHQHQRANKVSLRAEVLVRPARHYPPEHPIQIARLLLDGHTRCHAQSARIAEGLGAYSEAERSCQSSSTLAIVAGTFGPKTRMTATPPRRRLRSPL